MRNHNSFVDLLSFWLARASVPHRGGKQGKPKTYKNLLSRVSTRCRHRFGVEGAKTLKEKQAKIHAAVQNAVGAPLRIPNQAIRLPIKSTTNGPTPKVDPFGSNIKRADKQKKEEASEKNSRAENTQRRKHQGKKKREKREKRTLGP